MKLIVVYSLTLIILFANVSAWAEDLIVSVVDGQGSEGGSGVPMIILLSTPCDEPVRVEFTTYEFLYSLNVPYPAKSGIDFAFTNGWITFAPGETNKMVMVTIIDDEINEAPEPFGFGLLSMSKGSQGRNPGRGTIIDDDILEIIINDTTVVEGSSGSRYAEFTYSTSRATEQDLVPPGSGFSLRNGTADTSDYRITGGNLYLCPVPLIRILFSEGMRYSVIPKTKMTRPSIYM